MGKYHTILFDLDGTLIDPKEGIFQSVQYALEKLQKPGLEDRELHFFIGPPLLLSFQKYCNFDEKTGKRAIDLYRKNYQAKGIYKNILFGGIHELLLTLKQKGCKCYVATSKPTVYAKQILENLEISQYFTEIVGSNLNLTRTSKSEIIRAVIGQITQEEKSQVIMIGDTKYDIEGAHSENIDSIAVLYGYGKKDDFKGTSQIKMVKNVEELSHFLLDNI